MAGRRGRDVTRISTARSSRPDGSAVQVEPDGDIELLCINTIRTLSMDAVENAASGHPGAPMGMAPMAYLLWTEFLRHDPADPDWVDRDRFILSAGHASMLLYSLLHLSGYGLELDELKAFRRWGSRTPGHPEFGVTPGVEVTTGPLGQGFATGVGMAMAERLLADRFNRPGLEIVDHCVYGIVSDGDLMEGISSEAASLAGHLMLSKIVYLYDSNGITIDGTTDLAFTEDVEKRFRAYGWHVQVVEDGNDLPGIRLALEEAIEDDRPSLITVRTEIGFGAPTKGGKPEAHGAPLGRAEVQAAKSGFGWPDSPDFLVPAAVRTHIEASVTRRRKARSGWLERFARYTEAHPLDAAEFQRSVAGDLPPGWDLGLPVFGTEDGPLATRKASGIALNAIAQSVPELVGGSADLAGSNNSAIDGAPYLEPLTSGRNIHFGVREHAMGATLNGLALHRGLRPYGATFLIFSDYLRPALRLAALMGVPSIFVFTHDSIGLGEDGPTHQPVEHLASLRAMPNLVVLRPGDANETVQAWRVAMTHRSGPVALCLSRQDLPVMRRTARSRAPVERGAYVLYDPPEGHPELILIGTGSEIHVCLEAARLLESVGISPRVVSMPSWELFERQQESYRCAVLPPEVQVRLAVEAGSPMGWCRWVGPAGGIVGLDRFGASAPAETLFQRFGFSPEAVAARALELLERAEEPDENEAT